MVNEPEPSRRVAWPDDSTNVVQPGVDVFEPPVQTPGDASLRHPELVTMADAIDQRPETHASRARKRRRTADRDGDRAPRPRLLRWMVAMATSAAIVIVDSYGTGGPVSEPTARAEGHLAATAPAPPPAVPTGRLLVRSMPSAARVMVDGEDRGETPLRIADLPVGPHSVRLENSNGTIRRWVILRDGETAAVVEALVAGWIAIFSRIRLDIYAKGRRIGSTEDGHLMIEPGRHELDLVNDRLGFRTTHVLEVEPGAVTAYTVPLPTGTVRFEGTDEVGVEVWIEGERVGVTPLGTVQVPIGTREFRMRFPGGAEAHEVVDVAVTGPTVITIDPPPVVDPERPRRVSPLFR